MVREVEKAGVANMVWYNYRRIPAVTMAKEMIDEGRLGKIYHYRSNFLQDWTISTDFPRVVKVYGDWMPKLQEVESLATC